MKSVSDFFHKFLKLSRDLELEKNIVIEAVKECAKIALEPSHITLKESMLSLQCTPLQRTQVGMYKSQIIEKLSASGITIKDIR